MADIDSLAAALFGTKRAETQEVLTDATTRTYTGTAVTDSEDGTVIVDLGGDVTLPDDIEGLAEYSADGVEVATGPGVRAGDEVIVTLVGGTPLKTPMVTGVAGEGDRQDERIHAIEADYVKASTLEADVADVGFLKADSATIKDMQADTAKVHDLTADQLSAATAYIASLNAKSVTAETLAADVAKVHDLTADQLSAAAAYIAQLSADSVTAQRIAAISGDFDAVRANAAKVANLTAAELEADHATIGTLDTTYATIANLNAANGRIANLESTKANISDLEADYITADEIEATYMHANMSNSDVAWIENGTIKNGAIVSAMINDVSANKLTAGTINGSVINVTNLNADNITTGTINGQRIGEGSLSLDKLSEDVYTEAEVDTIVDGLNDRIDGAIETHTGTAVPTLNNQPASSWNTTKLRDEHVGDVYYVVNSQSQQNGYCYRFTKSGSTYSWQLIKDSDVTAALSRLTTAEGKITTFDSDISKLKTDTGTLTTKTESLETRMSDAESDILDKVDTTTFNEVSDTVDQHSQTISQHTTAISNKADSSTVTAVTNRVSTVEQDISGINTTIGELQETVESKADGSTVTTISNKLNTVSDTVDGHTQSISSITSTQTTMQGKLDKTIVETTQLWYTKENTTAPNKPTSQVTSTSTSGGAWRTVVPAYSSSYPNYFYCYQWKYSDGTYGWSSVTRDIAMGESQSTSRTAASDASTAKTDATTAVTTANTASTNASDALTKANTADTNASTALTTANTAASDASTAKTNAASAVSTANTASTNASTAVSTANTAKATADKNVKSSLQLWFTKANETAPNKPTSKVTSTAVSGNGWRTVVPTYSASYPYYFYCYQYELADGTYTWSDVVYDRATTENQSNSRSAVSGVSTLTTKTNTISDTVDGHTQTLTSVQNTLSTKADSSTVSTLTTKVNNVSDTVDGHTSQLSSITSTQTTMQGTLNKTVKSSIQLWYSKANTTAPSKPTSQVTSTSTSGNAWRIVVPAYNSSYPHYYYCWQYEYADGTYGWSAVVRDIAMGESQSTARTADSNASAAVTTANTASTNASTALTTANTANTNASDAKTAATTASTTASEAKTTAETAASDASTAKTNAASAVSTANSASTTATNAQNTANANIKSSLQLWFTKANETAPNKPTSVVSTSNANTANAWNLVVPVWNKNYPHYFYCYQQQKGDGNYQWTDVVYDRATSEAQQLANTASTNLSTLQSDYATFKQQTEQFESTVGETYATKTELRTTDNKIENLEIGGRNLFALAGSVAGYMSAAGSVAEAQSAYKERTTDYIAIDAGTQYTVQAWYDTSNPTSSYMWLCLSWYTSEKDHISQPLRVHMTSSNYESWVFTSPSNAAYARISARWVESGYVYGKVKLEKGNKPTDWTPAPEDTDASIASIESRITTAETSIEQNKSAIALKANSSDVYTKTAVDGKITQEVSDRNAAITAKANEITSSVSETYATKTTVNGKADASDVTALAGRVTTAESNITQNAQNIELKVSKDGVISSINQSAETVKIQASKVEIDGTAVFSAISSDVDSAITSKGYQTASQVNTAITSKGYATTTQAQGYASTAKSEAISAAATDATTKANAAQTAATNAANTATDNKLKSYSTTAQANNLYDAKGAAQTVQDNLDNLEIGGRNILPNTQDWSGATKRTNGTITVTSGTYGGCSVLTHVWSSSNSDVGYQGNVWTQPIEADAWYTLSFWAKASSAIESMSYFYSSNVVDEGINSSGKTTTSADGTIKNTITTEWQRIWVSWHIKDDATSFPQQLIVARLQSQHSGVTLYLAGPKLEKGNKATDWTPAPEDIEASAVKRTQRIWYRTNASSAPATPGTASSNWVTKADDGNDAWTKMHIAISSTHKYIYTCEQYEMANGTVGYTSVLLDNTITVIDGGNIITGSVTANKLNAADINASKSLTVGAMTDAAASSILNSNVDVGGRNLSVEADYYEGFLQGNVTTLGPMDATRQEHTSDFILVKTGDKYVFQTWVTPTTGSTEFLWMAYQLYDSSKALLGSRPSKIAGGNTGLPQHETYEITIPSGAAYIRISARLYSDGKMKLEKGNKATDWTPAPEDMATAESLAGTNESLEGAIEDIGELSDQLSGTVTEQNKTITTIQTYLNSLRKDLDAEIQSRQQWLNFNAAEGLVIGAAGSSFKTVTTNTSQQFRSGGTVLAETSGTEFVAPVMRSDQLLIGNWMWTRRDNGNLSLKWIG